jgi:hypothetical protein
MEKIKVIDRETKVLMLQVLKQGYATNNQAAMIAYTFSEHQPELDMSFLTDEEREYMLSISERMFKHNGM